MSSYTKKSRIQIKQILVTLFSFTLFIYFAYHLIYGEMGYFAMRGVEERLKIAKENEKDLAEDRAALENRVKRLRPDSLDLDMLDERSRAVLAFGHENEIIIVEKKQ